MRTTEPTNTPRPTNTLRPTNTPKPTDTPGPTNTPTAEPTNTPTVELEPSATFEPFPSGGLGLSKAEWDQQHTEGDTAFGMIEYDDSKYLVMFADDKVQYVEQVFTANYTLNQARTAAQRLFPYDGQFLEAYSPEGMPELTVDLYMSESLKERFDSDVFFAGEPGNFIAIYGVFDGRIPRVVISTGNNP